MNYVCKGCGFIVSHRDHHNLEKCKDNVKYLVKEEFKKNKEELRKK